MKNLFFILLIAATLFLAIFFYWQLKTTQNGLALETQRVTDRDTRIYKQDKLVDSLQKRLSGQTTTLTSEDTIALPTPPSAQFMDELGSLSESEIGRLRKKGLKSPEVELKNSLMKNQNLIPAKGKTGSDMVFGDIRILNDQYALASYENGQNRGNMILKFTVTNGNISWKVLDSQNL